MSATAPSILHHYAPQHAIAGIRRKGLTKGAIPWNYDKAGEPTMATHLSGNPRMRGPGFQWLTTSTVWDQPFCLMGSLPFPKNAYRVTVLVPDRAKKFLFKWTELCERGRPDCAQFVNTKAVDFDNWWVFYGPIPPTWFLEVARNMGQQIIADVHGTG
jgi:hypothetical protein